MGAKNAGCDPLKAKIILTLVLSTVFFLAGCGQAPALYGPTGANDVGSGDIGGFSYGADADWPDYIPDDIPPVPGDITTVMTGDDRVRIFFENVSQNEMDAYLYALSQNGFSLEYVIYTQEGFPDNSEERRQKGEYDAVRITKGTYNMTIEYGGNEGTYDIDTSGFETVSQGNTGPDWPQELKGVLDPPEACTIQAVMPAGDGATFVQCASENTALLSEYAAKLQTQGFAIEKESKDQNGDIIEITLKKDTVTVSIRNYGMGRIGITVWTGGSYSSGYTP